jgi:hypothetical protein
MATPWDKKGGERKIKRKRKEKDLREPGPRGQGVGFAVPQCYFPWSLRLGLATGQPDSNQSEKPPVLAARKPSEVRMRAAMPERPPAAQ